MFNDLRAERFRYNDCDLAATLAELEAASRGFCAEIACCDQDDWDRSATRLPNERRTARWLVRQAMHEGVHHLGDIRRIGRCTHTIRVTELPACTYGERGIMGRDHIH
jgi:hypothetical protein